MHDSELKGITDAEAVVAMEPSIRGTLFTTKDLSKWPPAWELSLWNTALASTSNEARMSCTAAV